MNRKLRMGMVGGGQESFVGAVHRIAAAMDGKIELVCGSFSSARRKSMDSGRELMLPAERVYGTYREMFRRESKLDESDRMDFVSIVTPNNMHYPVSMAAIDAGFHVVCEKPMTLLLDEALNLERKLKQSGKLFCLTHNFTGHPMVKEARGLFKRDKLGEVRRVVVEYPQGWLSTRLETSGQKQAAWRTDPRRAGATCCMGDIGSQCANLVEYITGLRVSEVCADLATFVAGRPLDDDASVLLRFSNGARGVLWASQIAVGGEEDGLNIRVYAEKGGLTWRQQEPNTLVVHWLNKATEIRRIAGTFAYRPATEGASRPVWHPEGYLEAFANIYDTFAETLFGVLDGKKVDERKVDYPTVHDGLRVMAFLDAVVRSAKGPEKWVAV